MVTEESLKPINFCRCSEVTPSPVWSWVSLQKWPPKYYWRYSPPKFQTSFSILYLWWESTSSFWEAYELCVTALTLCKPWTMRDFNLLKVGLERWNSVLVGLSLIYDWPAPNVVPQALPGVIPEHKEMSKPWISPAKKIKKGGGGGGMQRYGISLIGPWG